MSADEHTMGFAGSLPDVEQPQVDYNDDELDAMRCGCGSGTSARFYRPPRRYPAPTFVVGAGGALVPAFLPVAAPFPVPPVPPTNAFGQPVQHLGRPPSWMPISQSADLLLPGAIPDYTIRGTSKQPAPVGKPPATEVAGSGAPLLASALAAGSAVEQIQKALATRYPAQCVATSTPDGQVQRCQMIVPLSPQSCSAVGGTPGANNAQTGQPTCSITATGCSTC